MFFTGDAREPAASTPARSAGMDPPSSRCPCERSGAAGQLAQGSSRSTPTPVSERTSRVTKIMPCSIAAAAMRPSIGGNGAVPRSTPQRSEMARETAMRRSRTRRSAGRSRPQRRRPDRRFRGAEGLDPVSDLAENEHAHPEIRRIDPTRPRGNRRRTPGSLAELTDDVRIEEVPQSSISGPGSRSRSIGGRDRRAEEPARNAAKSVDRPRSRRYSSTPSTTATSLPCRVTI